MEKLTLDTMLIREKWSDRPKRPIVEKLLDFARGSDDIELVVTKVIERDVPDDPLASRLAELPDMGIIPLKHDLARLGTWQIGVDFLGSEEYLQLEHSIREALKASGTSERRTPDFRDFEHVHHHFALGRDFFLTWDGPLLGIAPSLATLGIRICKPEEYLESRGVR